MKTIIYILLTCCSLIACNNQSSDNSKAGGEKVAASAENTSSTAGGCGSLVLFHKGAVIEGTSYDSAGKQTSKQITTVTDVQDEGGILVAHSSSLMTGSKMGERTMNLVYKCDGNNLYIDMTSMLQNFDFLKNIKGEIKPIEFPINISVGQSLPDASYTITMDRGKVKMDITSSYKNRTVSAKENITTTAGSWDCYKVSADVVSDVETADALTKKIMDAVKDKMKMKMVMWYTPKMGIVRTEMYQNERLSSRSDITSVKE